jgi:hypothetical protein
MTVRCLREGQRQRVLVAESSATKKSQRAKRIDVNGALVVSIKASERVTRQRCGAHVGNLNCKGLFENCGREDCSAAREAIRKAEGE